MKDAPDFLVRYVAPLLEELAGGEWVNLVPYDQPSWGVLFARNLRASIAASHGWIELRDETWARITDEGRKALSEAKR